MPLYEDKNNAENIIKISDEAKNSVVFNTGAVVGKIAEIISGADRPIKIALDGWYGIDWREIVESIGAALKSKGVESKFVSARTLFSSSEQIQEYKKKFITDDPSFGWANLDGKMQDIMDDGKIQALKADMDNFSEDVLIVYSPGAAIPGLIESYDLVFYFEKTHQTVLWLMWDGKLVPFGREAADRDYFWKEFYYCDYYLLLRQKEYVIDKIDYFVEATSFSGLKLIPRKAYDEIIQTLLKYPIKEVDYYQPGPWGAYRFKDFVEVEGLENNAWHLAVGPDLSVLIDIGAEAMLNIPFSDLMQYSEGLVGKYIHETYPSLFPAHIAIDDGYFPEPQPYERTSMPMHNHPGTDYVKRHFNEPLGRYETYYIAEAFEGATTWLGYRESTDTEEWEAKCRESDNKALIENWQDYVCKWDTRAGDLFLIPPGSVHGHGGNQIVLEMDTCPSIPATEYSFFQHDFARNTWNDRSKTMTAKPMRMHLEHAFDNDRWRRESFVRDNQCAVPKVVRWTKDYCMERYSTLSEMPFEIERFHFYSRAENDTYSKFFHVVCLTIGKHAVIRSKSNPEYKTGLKYMQCAIIPASFGEYEIISSDGGFSTIVLFRWKK